NSGETGLEFVDVATQAELDAHTSRTDNPHGVTAAQAGAVDKTGDTMQPMTDGVVLSINNTSGSTIWSVDTSANRMFLSDANGNVFVGNGAGNGSVTGTDNVGIGSSALSSLTTGYGNFALGGNSMKQATTAYRCMAVGNETLVNLTTGAENIAIGYGALNRVTTGSSNIGIGTYANYGITTTTSNIAIGKQSMNNNAGWANVGIGVQSGLYKTSGDLNTFIGFQAGYGNGVYSSASKNTLIGARAGRYITSSSNDNVLIGYLSGYNIGTASTNTFIGSQSGYNAVGTTGCIFIGYQAGYSETNSNRLYIANSSTTTPLIYGEFDNRLIVVNGRLRVTDNSAAPVAGDIRFNTTTNKHEGYDGTTWYAMY
ncbi:MAG: hypothetical protein D6694_15375, partial [Gammaproteobacteria bacterium]